MKALMPIKAKALDPDEEQAWFAGKVPRRLLAIPFGGPIPSGKSKIGVDLDGEWFSSRTDIYGGYKLLRENRERLVDWHHSASPPGPAYGDPTGRMKGAIIGKSLLDPEPDEDGWWVDLWLNVGEKRINLIRKLAERGAQLFGSSQPLKSRIDSQTGEILEWPFWLETLSTSPQNTYSVLRPAKAVLEADLAGITVSEGLRALLADARTLDASLRDPSIASDDVAKAGRELSGTNDQEIEAALEALGTGYDRLRALLSRVREKYPKKGDNSNG